MTTKRKPIVRLLCLAALVLLVLNSAVITVPATLAVAVLAIFVMNEG